MRRKVSISSHWIAYAIAIAGAGLLVYWCRLARPLWVDEEMIALNARWRSFADLGGPLWLDQSAPLGWLALERAALVVFGTGERAARALPVLCGIGTLIVAAWIGRRWMTAIGAAILVGLCAIGPWIVFFTLELKQYSSDVCWALFVPALAAWALEADGRDRVMRRIAVWWTVAAMGSWLSNGATFVAPACAVILVCRTWQKYGVRDGVRAAVSGIVWFVSFGVHYTLALRHAIDNEYLKNYWGFAYPPLSEGVFETLQWVGRWVQSFALKPVGTEHWALFWAATLVGFVYATAKHGTFGLLFASVPLSALTLGMLHVVPPFERLGLWCVPALYVGLALCADATSWIAYHSRWRPPTLRTAAIVSAALVVTIVSLDIVTRGRNELDAKRPDNNYGLDDRRSIRFVLRARQPGDPVLTTHFGLAGLWWYGGVDISDPSRAGFLGDSPIFEIAHDADEERCTRDRDDIDALTARTGRAIVYLGFRMNVEPEGFDKLVLDELGKRGAIVGYHRYADLSHLVEFDFRQPPNGAGDRFFTRPNTPPLPSLSGCVAVRPARRW